MSRSLVEEYEQILSKDPSSKTFVELARVLIDNGDHNRAVDVCQTGVGFHRNSVAGRVLWGKALIHLGRPAEAMEQFDKAISIDRENSHAYNLIGEVLLRKGLYRSALPILKKAAALQPSDGRVRQLLEQTQAALAGGPPPVIIDHADPQFELGDSPATDPAIPAVVEPPAPSAQASPLTREEEADVPSTDPPTTPAPPSDLHSGPPLVEEIEEVLPEEVKEEEARPSLAAVPPPISGKHKARTTLLDEIPVLSEQASVLDIPKVEVSAKAAAAIASEFERELRQKLEEEREQVEQSFVARHGLKALLGVGLVIALGGSVALYVAIRHKNRGADLVSDIAEAKKCIAVDTPKLYRTGLEALRHAIRLDSQHVEAWALTAYAHAILFAETGADPEDEKAAIEALAQPGVRERFPGLARVSDYYLTRPDSPKREELTRSILGSGMEWPEVNELAGRLLLKRGDSKAGLARLDKVLKVVPDNIRALVALGDYYLAAGDFPTALNFFATAGQRSPKHPERVLGAAEARLGLGEGASDSIPDVEGLAGDPNLPKEAQARRELVLGKLLSLAGRHEQALQVLKDGAFRYSARGFDFDMALGDANRAAGKMEAAQKAFESARKARPASVEAKEALARLLVARDREREALGLLRGDANPKLAMVRGLAYVRLGDWKSARAELEKTRVDDKYLPEAIMYLAMADAAEGKPERAAEFLEKAVKVAKKNKSALEVALGQLYWRQGSLEKARAQFTDAAADPRDVEGNCSLGRLLLELPNEGEAATRPLLTAVSRNGSHGEARRALGRAFLALGREADALKEFEAWQADNPTSPEAPLGLARAHLQAGRLREADVAAQRAAKLSAQDARALRLLGSIQSRGGDPRQAVRTLERAAKLAPKDPLNACEQGFSLVRTGKKDAAQKAFAHAKKLDPKAACATLGEHLARLPQGTATAVKDLTELVAGGLGAPERGLAMAVLARVQLGLGDLDAAKKAAEEAGRLSPNEAQGHLAWALIHLKEQDDPKAITSLEKVVELEPNYVAARLLLADTLARGGEADLAKVMAAYEAFLALGGDATDQARAKRVVAQLKKKGATR